MLFQKNYKNLIKPSVICANNCEKKLKNKKIYKKMSADLKYVVIILFLQKQT
jgi:hypothetical protein